MGTQDVGTEDTNSRGTYEIHQRRDLLLEVRFDYCFIGWLDTVLVRSHSAVEALSESAE